MKTLGLESHFNKVAGMKACFSGVHRRILQNFKENLF